jgi:hypothetical protein
MNLGPILAWLVAAATPLQNASSAPVSAPVERQWGRPVAGLSLSAVARGHWTLGEEWNLDLGVRNDGSSPVTLSGREHFFAYLLLAQGKTVHYTEKVFPARDLADWPEKLQAGQTLALPVPQVGKLKAFPQSPGMKLVEGYPAGSSQPAESPPSDETVEQVLSAGPVRIKCIVYVARTGERALLLESQPQQLTVAVGQFARLSPALQRRMLDDLVERLGKDEFSARSAHADAVRVGPAAVGVLAGVVRNRQAPPFARMWAATALADIGDAGAVPALIECLSDPAAGVRHVAAYHGLKVKDGQFDQALNKLALGGDDPMLTAWAVLGYLRFRPPVPRALLEAGPQSKQWQVRAAVVETIARARPDRSHLPMLGRLVGDEKEAIRAKAAEAIRFVGDKSSGTIDALVAGLALEGDAAREAVVATLIDLTGNNWPYLPSASPQGRQDTVERWLNWWHQAKGKWPKQGG